LHDAANTKGGKWIKELPNAAAILLLLERFLSILFLISGTFHVGGRASPPFLRPTPRVCRVIPLLLLPISPGGEQDSRAVLDAIE
jgi:hypothetical protein